MQNRRAGSRTARHLGARSRARAYPPGSSSRLGQYPQWSPDGTRIAWLTRNDEDVIGIYEKRANGVGDESLLLKIGADVGGTHVPDRLVVRRTVPALLRAQRADPHRHLGAAALRRPQAVSRAQHASSTSTRGSSRPTAAGSRIDPTSMAVMRSTSGPSPLTARWERSDGASRPAGGSQPRFRRDGRELFYLADDGWMMAVALTTTATTFDSKRADSGCSRRGC